MPAQMPAPQAARHRTAGIRAASGAAQDGGKTGRRRGGIRAASGAAQDGRQ